MARATDTGTGDDDSDDGDRDDVEVVAETVARIGPENGADSMKTLLSRTFGPLPARICVGAGWVLLLLL